MGGQLSVVSSQPLPDLVVKSSAPLPPASSQQSTIPRWPITPIEGEDFADTMKRAVEAGKSVTPAEMQESEKAARDPKKIATVLTAAALAGPALLGAGVIAPEAASAAAGGGALGGAAGGAAGGAGSELLRQGLHVAGGDTDALSARDLGIATLTGGAFGGALGLFGKVANSLFTSKVARGAINESLGATARDVTYGNPAKAILDEGINSPFTGDIEKYKAALRAGAPPEQALVAAGGRVAGVSQKISELSPQIDQALSKSAAKIPVADVIDKPLMSAATDVINNKAMTQAEKDAALTQLGALQHSLKEGLGDTFSPLEANKIKQAIGSRINWAGNIAVTDEVKPAYRAVYASLKNAVNGAVPEMATINERLTNLLAAQTDLEMLMKSEEVGMGKGALGSAVTGIARRAEAVAGRAVPGIRTATQVAPRIAPFSGGPIGTAAAQLLAQQFKPLSDMQ